MDSGDNKQAGVVECREVTKVYEGAGAGGKASVRALDNVSLRVEGGTIIGLIGPNGAGKSTLLGLIAGLLFPTGGTVRVCGHPARSLEARRSLGYVPESPAFLPRYSARAVLRHHAALHGLSRRAGADESERLLAQLRLQEYADRAVGGFSQGMRQRLALAVALLDRPRLLLLDEPSNGLDPIGVIELRRVLTEVRQSGATVLISSHRLGELEKLTSEYVFLHRGRIVQFNGEMPVGQKLRLRIDFLPGRPDVDEETLAPYGPLEKSETHLVVGVDDMQRVPHVVRALVKGGIDIVGVALELQDIEQTFVHLCHERSTS
ncbi:MAG: ABC transporter ATP-binding protein [Sedimentisphaerales bacterium]|nr:ABC transporter ATP-binding protein [Sedimentisphaerales bacterium]